VPNQNQDLSSDVTLNVFRNINRQDTSPEGST